MKWIALVFPRLMTAAVFLAAGPAFANVSNEIIVGIEGDSSNEVTQSVGGVTTDLTDTFKVSNSQFTLQYTRFFEPLMNDDSPIALRRFLQHPSTLTAGLVALGHTVEDTTILGTDKEITTNASLLALGGEYFFPTNTGLFLNIGFGSGTQKDSVNGVDQPELNEDLNTYEIGLRQYVAPSVALHLTVSGNKIHAYTKDAVPAWIVDRKESVVLLGVDGVIKKMVELSFELGGGSRTDTQTGSAGTDFDLGEVNFAAAVYPGNHLSFRLDVEAESVKQTGLPSGFEYSESTARVTLSATYWFSERFGLRLPIYSQTDETKDVVGSLETKTTEKDSGLGLYAGFRF